MNALLTALFAKVAVGTALYTDISGRIYLDEAPENTAFPYIVVSVISGTPNDTFTEGIDETLIQFSLFSTSRSVAEIADMYADLKTLFDNASMTVTGNSFLSCERVNLVTMLEDITTSTGTETVKHWAVDYLIKVKEGT